MRRKGNIGNSGTANSEACSVISESDPVTISVDHVTKHFRLYEDKSHTLKDRVLSSKRNRYKVQTVLDDVSFTVRKGEAVGLIGHNGCGKSTTLKLLNKILYPDEGTITMRGKISSLIELGAGFHPDMSGRENIYINASIFGLKKKEIDERLEDIIRFSELEDFIDNPVRTYSSGMYMRLAFSIAINVNADILLIDEILAVGDANFQEKCFDKLKEIKDEGTTIVIVSHSMSQIQHFCDRAIWLDGGKIREEGRPLIVCEDYLVVMGDKAAQRRREEQQKVTGNAVIDPNREYPPAQVSSQASRWARRSGHMKARFTAAVLEDLEGEAKLRFSFQEQFRFRFRFVNETDAPVSVIINVVKDGGAICTTQDSCDRGILFGRGTNSGSLLIEDFPVTGGTYYIDAMIADEKGDLEDLLNVFIKFDIDPAVPEEKGLVKVKTKWETC